MYWQVLKTNCDAKVCCRTGTSESAVKKVPFGPKALWSRVGGSKCARSQFTSCFKRLDTGSGDGCCGTGGKNGNSNQADLEADFVFPLFYHPTKSSNDDGHNNHDDTMLANSKHSIWTNDKVNEDGPHRCRWHFLLVSLQSYLPAQVPAVYTLSLLRTLLLLQTIIVGSGLWLRTRRKLARPHCRRLSARLTNHWLWRRSTPTSSRTDPVGWPYTLNYLLYSNIMISHSKLITARSFCSRGGSSTARMLQKKNDSIR